MRARPIHVSVALVLLLIGGLVYRELSRESGGPRPQRTTPGRTEGTVAGSRVAQGPVSDAQPSVSGPPSPIGSPYQVSPVSDPTSALPPEPDSSAELVIHRPDRSPRIVDVPCNSVMEGASEARARAATSISRWLACARDPNAPPGDRVRAIRGLAVCLDSPGAADVFLAAFHDPEPGIRSAATNFVIYSEWRDIGPRLVNETLKLATSDSDQRVRANAQQAVLAYVTDPSVFPTALSWLNAPPVAGDHPEDSALLAIRASIGELSNAQLRDFYRATCILRDRLQSKSNRDDFEEQLLSHALDAITELKEEAARNE